MIHTDGRPTIAMHESDALADTEEHSLAVLPGEDLRAYCERRSGAERRTLKPWHVAIGEALYATE